MSLNQDKDELLAIAKVLLDSIVEELPAESRLVVRAKAWLELFADTSDDAYICGRARMSEPAERLADKPK